MLRPVASSPQAEVRPPAQRRRARQSRTRQCSAAPPPIPSARLDPSRQRSASRSARVRASGRSTSAASTSDTDDFRVIPTPPGSRSTAADAFTRLAASSHGATCRSSVLPRDGVPAGRRHAPRSRRSCVPGTACGSTEPRATSTSAPRTPVLKVCGSRSASGIVLRAGGDLVDRADGRRHRRDGDHDPSASPSGRERSACARRSGRGAAEILCQFLMEARLPDLAGRRASASPLAASIGWAVHLHLSGFPISLPRGGRSPSASASPPRSGIFFDVPRVSAASRLDPDRSPPLRVESGARGCTGCAHQGHRVTLGQSLCTLDAAANRIRHWDTVSSRRCGVVDRSVDTCKCLPNIPVLLLRCLVAPVNGRI